MTTICILLPLFALLGAGAVADQPQRADAGAQGAAPDPLTPPRIPLSGKTVEAFVPKGYEIFDRKEADFDGDGQIDVVLGLQVADEIAAYDNPRPLIILFRQPDGSYRLSARSDQAIYTTPPGAHGDSFYGICVKGRSILLSTGGISRAGASGGEQTEIYRFQSGDWYLIGTVDHQWNRVEDGVECPGITLKPGEVCDDLTVSRNLNTSQVEFRAEVVRGNPDDGDAPTRTVIRRQAIPRTALQRLEDASSPRSPAWSTPP